MSGMFSIATGIDKHKSVEWYTPKWVFEELDLTFDLDPASPHDHETFVPAVRKLTVFDDGLSQDWSGRVWLNPPYGKATPFWMSRMNAHGNGVALVFSRTDTSWWQESLRGCDAALFVAGRINFVPGHENKHKRSRAGAGTVLFAWGADCAAALQKLSARGYFFKRQEQA